MSKFQIINRFFPFQKMDPPAREAAQYVRKLTAASNRNVNTHRSNRAKKGGFKATFVLLLVTFLAGLYHGKDIRFGSSISHSCAKTNRSFKPNVQDKRVWSECLNDWVRFKMTTRAMKVIDNVGGIDNYILSLDEKQIEDANYIKNVRAVIASTKYYDGSLHPEIAKRYGFLVEPPRKPEEILEEQKLIKQAHSIRFRGRPEPLARKIW